MVFGREKKIFLKNKGFTLIELLVIITILLFFIIIASVNFSDMRKKSRDIKGKNDLKQIINALELRYNDLAYYPTTIPVYSSCLTGLCGQPIALTSTTDLEPYLNPVPTGNGVREYYWYRESGNRPQKFCLYFQLELEPSSYFTCSNSGCIIKNDTTCLGF